MKTLSMAVIIASCVMLGIILNKNEESKIKRQELLISFLQDVKAHLECTLFSTKEMFLSLSENSEYRKLAFLEECCGLLKKGFDFPVSYKTAVNNETQLTQPCKKIMLSLCEKLGTTDLSGQLSYIELSINKIKNECEQLKEKYRKKENMYLPLSALTGIGIAIMMY